MSILAWLVPISLVLGGLGLGAFLWSLRARQYDDPEGAAYRILSDRWDGAPAPDPEQQNGASGDQTRR